MLQIVPPLWLQPCVPVPGPSFRLPIPRRNRDFMAPTPELPQTQHPLSELVGFPSLCVYPFLTPGGQPGLGCPYLISVSRPWVERFVTWLLLTRLSTAQHVAVTLGDGTPHLVKGPCRARSH